jgi:hypothetical protein
MERSEIRDLPTPETKSRITLRSIQATRYSLGGMMGKTGNNEARKPCHGPADITLGAAAQLNALSP